MENNIETLKELEFSLWDEREEILEQLHEINTHMQHLAMEQCALESDLIQEIGMTREEYLSRRTLLEEEASQLEDQKYALEEAFSIVNRKLKTILDTLSIKITEDVPL